MGTSSEMVGDSRSDNNSLLCAWHSPEQLSLLSHPLRPIPLSSPQLTVGGTEVERLAQGHTSDQWP